MEIQRFITYRHKKHWWKKIAVTPLFYERLQMATPILSVGKFSVLVNIVKIGFFEVTESIPGVDFGLRWTSFDLLRPRPLFSHTDYLFKTIFWLEYERELIRDWLYFNYFQLIWIACYSPQIYSNMFWTYLVDNKNNNNQVYEFYWMQSIYVISRWTVGLMILQWTSNHNQLFSLKTIKHQ